MITRCRKGTPSVLINYALGHDPLSQKVLETELMRAFTIIAQGHWGYESLRTEDTYPTTCQQIDKFVTNNIKIDPRTKTDEVVSENNLKINFKINKIYIKNIIGNLNILGLYNKITNAIFILYRYSYGLRLRT